MNERPTIAELEKMIQQGTRVELNSDGTVKTCGNHGPEAMETFLQEQAAEKTDFKVRALVVGRVDKHPNADTLSMTEIDGCTVIFKTGDFREGDLAVYVPIDAMVPTSLPAFEFLKRDDRRLPARIKAKRLRGIFSMGLLVPFPFGDWRPAGVTAWEAWMNHNEYAATVGNDLMVSDARMSEMLVQHFGITKYVPPEERLHTSRGVDRGAMKQMRKALRDCPKMPVYGLDSFRKHGSALPFGTQVTVTEKLHGMNARFCFSKSRLWVGSHKAIRGASKNPVGVFFERMKLRLLGLLGLTHRNHAVEKHGDIWWGIAERLGLREKLAKKPGYILFGEVYGKGLQRLSYDAPDQPKFRAFDVFDTTTGRFLDYADFILFLREIGLDPGVHAVPCLYQGAWTPEMADAWKRYADQGRSSLNGNETVEGIVVKPIVEMRDPRIGRIALKYVGQGYLLEEK